MPKNKIAKNIILKRITSYYCKIIKSNVEIVLTEIEKQEEKDDIDKIVKASLYKKYCEDVIIKNLHSNYYTSSKCGNEFNEI